MTTSNRKSTDKNTKKKKVLGMKGGKVTKDIWKMVGFLPREEITQTCRRILT